MKDYTEDAKRIATDFSFQFIGSDEQDDIERRVAALAASAYRDGVASTRPTPDVIAAVITQAAKAMEDVSALSRHVLNRGTVEMIIRDLVVTPLVPALPAEQKT